MSISSTWDLASDAELITAVRTGDSAAFGVLYERHVGASRAVARQYSNSAADAEDAVAEAFSKVFAAIQQGGGPDVAFRAYLFTVLRRVALARVEGGRRTQPTDDFAAFESAFAPVESTEEPTIAGFERGVVSQAYKSLPERWQAVLWYTEVEELSPAEIAPILGLTANGVAALAYRAREGLRQAYLQEHLASPSDEACTIVNGKLGAYVRGGLAKRETALVDSHLEECGRCRALVLELGDVNHGMRVFIAPLVLGAVAWTVLHGVGFGGAAGAAGAAAAGTAGAGAGTGTGAGAGTGVGAGTGAGAGAGGGGALVGSGVAAGGVAAVGGAALAVNNAGSAAATSTTAGGTAAGAASTGGLAGLVASVPVGAIGLGVAGLVVAGSVGIAGLLGVFSPDTTGDDPTDVIAEPDDEADDDLPSDLPTDAPDDDGPGPDDPTNIPADVDEPDDQQVGVQDPSDDPRTTDPEDPRTEDPDTEDPNEPEEPEEPEEPQDPARLEIDAELEALTFTADAETAVEVGVRNTGGTATTGAVHAGFTFYDGATGSVSPLLASRFAFGFARAAADQGWTCGPATAATTVVCSRGALAQGESSTLRVGVVVHSEVDGESALTLGVATWEGSPDKAPAPTKVTTKVRSAPANLVVGDADAALVLSGDPDAPALGGTITYPIGNTGGTSVAAQAEVLLPADVDGRPFPSSVTVTARAPWDCARSGARLACEVPSLGRGTSVPLVLDVDASVLDPDAPAPLRDVRVDGEAVLRLTSASPVEVETGVAPVELSTAPDRLGATIEQLPSGPGAPVDLLVTAQNTGGTTATDVPVVVTVPRGVSLPAGGGDWARCEEPAGSFCRTVAELGFDAAGDPVPVALPLTVVAGLGQFPGDEFTVTARVGDGAPARLVVQIAPEPDLSTSTLTVPERLVGDQVGTVTVGLVNTGGAPAEAVVRLALPDGTTVEQAEGWELRGGVSPAWVREVEVAAGASASVSLTLRGTVSTETAATIGATISGAGETVRLSRPVVLAPAPEPEVRTATIGQELAGAQRCGPGEGPDSWCTWNPVSQRLDLPEGAEVEQATLTWAAGVPGKRNDSVSDSALGSLSFIVPGPTGSLTVSPTGGPLRSTVERRAVSSSEAVSGFAYVTTADLSPAFVDPPAGAPLASGRYQPSHIQTAPKSTASWTLSVRYTVPVGRGIR